MEKIRFRDLSLPLKIQIILNWIIIGNFTFWFIIGMLITVAEGI